MTAHRNPPLPKGKPRSRKKAQTNPPKRRKKKRKTLIALTAIILLIGSYLYLCQQTSKYQVSDYHKKLPDGYTIHGLDISHHQGDINWEVLTQSQENQPPIRFIFIKATEGGDLLDTRFHTNFTQAKQKGFTCGAYHFYNPQTSPGRQAAFFIQNVTLSTGDLPPVLDIEKRGNKPLSTFQHEILTWLQKVEKHYQTKPIIYTSYRFKESYLNDSIFNTYPFWIAHYYVEQVSYPHQWHFWQHTDNATIPGVQSLVDLNVFNGTESQFQEMTIQKERPTT